MADAETKHDSASGYPLASPPRYRTLAVFVHTVVSDIMGECMYLSSRFVIDDQWPWLACLLKDFREHDLTNDQ